MDLISCEDTRLKRAHQEGATISAGPGTEGDIREAIEVPAFGNAHRGSFTGLGFTKLDASLHAVGSMAFDQKHQLSTGFEANNLLNHPNRNMPNMTFTFSTLRRISGTGRMRRLQLAANSKSDFLCGFGCVPNLNHLKDQQT